MKNKIPKIRFKGFDEEWVEYLLSDVTDYYNGKGHEDRQASTGKYELINLNSISIDGGLKPSGKFIEETNTTLKKNDLVMVLSDVGHGDLLGRVALIPENNKYVLNQRVALLRPNKKANPNFLFFDINAHQNYFKLQGAGMSQLNISKNSVEDYKSYIPSQKIEQTQIGNFFQNLDKLIESKQKRYDKLQNIKKAMLEKMFPKNGATTPQIRFKGFDEEWVEKRLGEVANSFSGGTPTVGIKEYYGGNIPFIRSGEINSKSTELFITNKALQNSSAKIINKGDILYALYGATSGEVGISFIKGAINQAILAIIPKSNFNSYFIAQWLRKEKKNIISTYLQGGQGNLSGNIVKDLNIYIPKEKEQTKIGNFFQKLDKLLSLQKQELEKLKNIKKALLEKMFV